MSKEHYLLSIADRIFDPLESFWEGKRFHSFLRYFFVLSFLAALVLIELQRQNLLPPGRFNFIPGNHFYAVAFVFNLLLVIEVVSLVFSLAHSTCNALGKQFEILSLILLRSSFKEFIYFSEPLVWSSFSQPIFHILNDAGGAFLIFIFLGFYYRMQKHRRITKSQEDLDHFISAKKALALMLLFVFIVLGGINLFDQIFLHGEHNFFTVFYTILIFSDILRCAILTTITRFSVIPVLP